MVEPMGADSLVWLRRGAETSLSVRLDGDTRVADGDRLPVAFPPERLSLFDDATGARL
jgi:multiple sugar transport system ATP-binding protein